MNETEMLAGWLKNFQGLNSTKGVAELANAAEKVVPVIEGKIDRLKLENEPATFEGLLHELAPKELKGE